MSTRPLRVRYFLLSIFVMVLCLPPSSAVAQLTAVDTVLLPNAPLMVTSYQTTASSATDFRYVEIYNSGDNLVNIADWKLYDVVNARYLQFSSTYSGYLQPDAHIVLAATDLATGMSEVGGATYRLDGWTPTASTPMVLKSLTVLQLVSEGYRPADVALKANGVQQIRNYGSSSYLTTFTEGSSRSLFDDGLYSAPVTPTGIEVSEVYSYASDCSPLDTSILCGDYIELHNATGHAIELTDLVLRTDSNSSSRTSSNTFTLDGLLAPDAYYVVTTNDDGARLSLTNSGGYIWIEDLWDTHAYAEYMTPWSSASADEQGLAYMRLDDGMWAWTMTPTPGFVNTFSAPIPVLAACSEGKYRSPETGRCRTIEEAVSELATCDEGYERNPTTNRCRKLLSSTSSSLTPCGEGQERNPLTNRCRSIASAVAELIPCDEGYERNPATNRCRKSQTDSVPSAPFAVEPTSTDVPAWQWIGGGAIAAGLAGYGLWEWRHELGKFWTRLIKK